MKYNDKYLTVNTEHNQWVGLSLIIITLDKDSCKNNVDWTIKRVYVYPWLV